MSSDLVLVTGASGYVASYCMLRLLQDGYRVAPAEERTLTSDVFWKKERRGDWR